MTYKIVHKTVYTYSSSVSLSLNDTCLLARPVGWQNLLEHQWVTDPQPDFVRDRTDFFGNKWRLFSFEKPHRSLELTSVHRIDVDEARGSALENPAGLAPFLRPSPYVRTSRQFADYGGRSRFEERTLDEALTDLTERLFQDFEYDPEATTIDTPVEDFFKNRRGVCQDFAHLTLSILRSLGIPSRYVSGYLNTTPAPGKEKVWGADATHAWISAYDPLLGWLAFDPTNGVPVRENHITLAWGRDYGDVTPVRGVVLGGGAQKLSVEVTVLSKSKNPKTLG